jgi:hypothetical protein
LCQRDPFWVVVERFLVGERPAPPTEKALQRTPAAKLHYEMLISLRAVQIPVGKGRGQKQNGIIQKFNCTYIPYEIKAARPQLVAQVRQHENVRQAPYASPSSIDSIQDCWRVSESTRVQETK